VLAADAGEDRRYVAVSRVERVAELAVMPANSGQAPLQRRDACRLRAVAGADVSSAGGDSADVSSAGMDAAVGAGGEIQPDRLWVGRSCEKPWRRCRTVAFSGTRGHWILGLSCCIISGLIHNFWE